MTDSSQKLLVLPPRRHAGAANKARTSHFSRIIASIACTDFQRQPCAVDWPATRSRRMNRPVSSVFANERLSAWLGSYLACRSDDSQAVRLIVTDSKACASAKAHFPFRCNNLKLIDASSVLAMDEKQSLALSSCQLKKEDVPPVLGAALGLRPDGREREPHDRTVRPGIQALALACKGHAEAKTRDRKAFQNYFHMLQASSLCLRLGHVPVPKSWVQLLGWTQTVAKRLFRRTRD